MGSAGRLLLAAVHACNLPRGTLVPSGVRAEKHIWPHTAPIQGRKATNPSSLSVFLWSMPGTILGQSIGTNRRHGCAARIFLQITPRNREEGRTFRDAASPLFACLLGAGIRLQRHYCLGPF